MSSKYSKAVIGNMPKLPYAIEEAVNRLRINISFLGTDVRKILVISTTPNEGKSFVAMQLWRQLAESGKSSVLLDMDLRKSVMVDKYDIRREDGKKIAGTSYYLANDMALQEALLQTDIGEGYILPNVDNIVNPSMIIEGHKLSDTLDQMAETFRYTILDCPPLDLVSDGERLAALCDGAVLVVRGGETPKSMVKNSIRQLERAGCPVLGVVLSRVKGKNGGYYSKRYGSKYGYYSNKDGSYYGKE